MRDNSTTLLGEMRPRVLESSARVDHCAGGRLSDVLSTWPPAYPSILPSDEVLMYRIVPPLLRYDSPPHSDVVQVPTETARLPFVIFGLWLGGALWWVSRRLYNNAGGYVALGLYCSSPFIVQASSTVNADILAAWGLFGIVYTAIVLLFGLILFEDRDLA